MLIQRISRAKDALIFPIFFLWAQAASAASTGSIGKIAETATDSVKMVSKAVVWGFLALGVYFVGKGILEFRKAGDPQSASQFSAGGSAAKVAVGGLLVALGALIGYVSGTFGLEPSGLVGSDLMPSSGSK